MGNIWEPYCLASHSSDTSISCFLLRRREILHSGGLFERPRCHSRHGNTPSRLLEFLLGVRRQGYYDLPRLQPANPRLLHSARCLGCRRPFQIACQLLLQLRQALSLDNCEARAAKSLADDLEEMSGEDRAKLKTALDDAVAGGPKAEAGAHRTKKMLGKATTAVGQALWKIIVDLASETAKKILTGS